MSNRKRTGKFYRNNEREVMRQLGFRETKGSGNGWIEKEDGENEKCLCQLKSTDANSIRIDRLDIEKLLYHANVSHKLPVFAIQFISSGDIYVMVRPEDINDVAKYIETGEVERRSTIEIEEKVEENVPQQLIKSNCEARNKFKEQLDKKYKKGIRSAT